MPDESGDVGSRQPVAARPRDLDGTQWRWQSAHCTEGPLDLSRRGYSARLRVHDDEGVLTLITDETFAAEHCQHTIFSRATPPDDESADWRMEEIARVAVPSTRECTGSPEQPRPGEVRRREDRLEVLIQRSQWCNGLEVRMVYAPASESLLASDEIVRRYVAHFTLGDAQALAHLFAESGSLLEPFTRTETGDPYRHDGRPAVQQWFASTFGTAPWRAMRITAVEEQRSQPGTTQQLVSWEYMDPRLSAPLTGRTRFTIAAGEIFEATIQLTSQPRLREAAQNATPG